MDTVRWLRVDERDRDHKKASQHCGEASVLDIGKHEEKIDLWRIHGKVYDLRPFLKSHPGGPDVLMSVRGTDDLTAIFESNHAFANRARIDAVMQKYYVSEGEPSALRFPKDGFYRVVTERVRAALPDGVHATWSYWAKAALLTLLWAVSFWLINFSCSSG